MAEVFGIVAGAIGVLDVSARGLQHLHRICTKWKHAPEEISALHNELQDLRVVIHQVKEAGKAIEAASPGDGVLATTLAVYLRNANEYVKQLNDSVDWLAAQSDIKKKYKWLRREGKVEDLKLRIRRVRESINSLLLAHGVINSTRVELDLVSMSTSVTRQHRALTTGLDALATSTTNTQDKLSTAHSDIQGLSAIISTNSQQVVASLEQTREEMKVMFQELISQSQTGLGLPKTTSNSDSPERPGQALPPSQPPKPQVNSAQFVQFTTTRRGRCHINCRCSCHRTSPSYSSFQLPEILSLILGSLFVRFSGWPARFSACDPDCSASRQTNIRFTYIFPIWLLQCSILFYLHKVTGRKPEMLLVLKNRVSFEDPFLDACLRGDVRSVQSLYREAPWRVRDVRDIDGCGPLFVAASIGHIEIVEFLISVDGAIDVENDNGQSVRAWLASRVILSDEISRHYSQEAQLLRVQDFIDETNLPAITRSILRLPGSFSLRDLVSSQPMMSLRETKTEDDFGITPLHWACRVGDAEAVRLLVQLGADINVCNIEGVTPLHEVAAYNAGSALKCMEILIRAGSELKSNKYGSTALHLASRYGTAEMTQALIDYGADLEHKEDTGCTPLHISAFHNNFPAFQTLVRNGADLEAVNGIGATAAHRAVVKNAHEIAQELFSRGVNLSAVSNAGFTILHLAANSGDVRTLSILTQHELRGFDINATDAWGWTAEDYFFNRDDLTVELESAFDDLLKAISKTNMSLRDSDGSRVVERLDLSE